MIGFAARLCTYLAATVVEAGLHVWLWLVDQTADARSEDAYDVWEEDSDAP